MIAPQVIGQASEWAPYEDDLESWVDIDASDSPALMVAVPMETEASEEELALIGIP